MKPVIISITFRTAFDWLIQIKSRIYLIENNVLPINKISSIIKDTQESEKNRPIKFTTGTTFIKFPKLKKKNFKISCLFILFYFFDKI